MLLTLSACTRTPTGPTYGQEMLVRNPDYKATPGTDPPTHNILFISNGTKVRYLYPSDKEGRVVVLVLEGEYRDRQVEVFTHTLQQGANK